MKFCCEHCGWPLSVADGQAGRKGRCPRCKRPVTIPTTLAAPVALHAASTTGSPAAAKSSPRDPLLFDMPPADAVGTGATGEPLTAEETRERLRAMQGDYLLRTSEKPPERPLPWVIDIFLYPLNKPGMLLLALSVGAPLLLRMMVVFTAALCVIFPPAMILWVVCFLGHWAILLLFMLYMAWYAAECVRDSAAGAIRATDTTGTTPGLGELFGQALTVLACGAACMLPALVHAKSGGGIGLTFWILYGVGGFVFPMALLAVIMFETLRALNPVLLLGSTFSTLAPYCALVPLCCAPCLLLPVALWFVVKSWTLGYLLLFLAFYQVLVQAHLLGRFYWKNQDRLNWDT